MAPLPAPEPSRLLHTSASLDARKLRFEVNRVVLPMGVEGTFGVIGILARRVVDGVDGIAGELGDHAALLEYLFASAVKVAVQGFREDRWINLLGERREALDISKDE